MNVHFSDMRSFLSEHNFNVNIITQATTLTMFMRRCLECKSEKYVENFKKEYQKNYPLSAVYVSFSEQFLKNFNCSLKFVFFICRTWKVFWTTVRRTLWWWRWLLKRPKRRRRSTSGRTSSPVFSVNMWASRAADSIVKAWFPALHWSFRQWVIVAIET